MSVLFSEDGIDLYSSRCMSDPNFMALALMSDPNFMALALIVSKKHG